MRNGYGQFPDEVARVFSRFDPHNLEHLRIEERHVTLYVRSRTPKTRRATQELAMVFPGHTFAALPAEWYHPDVQPPRDAGKANSLGVTGEALQAALRERGFAFKKPVEDRVGKGWFSVTGYCHELAADVCLAGPKPMVSRVQFNVVLNEADGQRRLAALLDFLRMVLPDSDGLGVTVRSWLLARLDLADRPDPTDRAEHRTPLEAGSVGISLEISPRPDRTRVVSLQVEECAAGEGPKLLRKGKVAMTPLATAPLIALAEAIRL
ncbi:MAG: hypothetical protein QME79_00410 [Bacillota bacterium]|nr:hypothetical protein [Bacillota bacterium]